MQKLINIQYQLTPNDPLQSYQYKIDLNSDYQLDYFTGKELRVQMDALKTALQAANIAPDAQIVTINQIAFKTTLSNLLGMLDRKDDYLSQILFHQAEVTNNTQEEPIPAPSEKQRDTILPPTDEPVILHSDLGKTGKIVYHADGSRKHESIMYMEKPIAPDQIITSIGISTLIKPVTYGAINPLIIKNQDIIFDNPLGLVPANGKITPNRLKNFAKKSKTNLADLEKMEPKALGDVDCSGTKYTLYAFIKPKTSAPIKSEEPHGVAPAPVSMSLDDLIDVKKELLSAIAGISKPDATDVPDEIITKVKTMSTAQKASYIYQLALQLGNGNLPDNLQTLKDPAIFLKAVNLISWNS